MTDDVLFFCQLRLNPITGFVARKSIPKELNPEFSCCAASSTNSSYLVRVIWRMLVQHLWYELFVLAMFPLPIPLFLAHLRESGNPGLHPSVVSSCGWSHTIDVGWLIDWQGGGCYTRHSALSVIKRRKPLIICWCLMSSLGSSGSFYFNILGSINFVHSLQILLLICGGKIQAIPLLA
jgi:hypothetical protein